MMPTLIQKLWTYILNLGVSDKHPDENELIRLYNGMSILTIIGSTMNLVIATSIDYPIMYLLVNSFIIGLYFAVPFFNYFDNFFGARYVISVGSPLWIGTANLFIGGSFSQGAGVMASMAITYVAFQKKNKVRWILLSLNIIVYLVTTIYVNNYGPINGVIDFPFDEISVFVGGLGWTIVVLYTFEKDKDTLLENLKTKNQELYAATEELERFTYIASHDLKSPLRNIISFIGLIERNLKKEKYDDIQENLNFVKTGAEQMHFLVKDILELSKLKSQEVVEHTSVDLNLVLEKAARNLKGEIEEKGAALDCRKLPIYYGNELEMVLLFQNFIQNGIKYNESEQPTISVSGKEERDYIQLSFADNGIGIEKEYHEQIFQFFKRLHNSTKYQGTGLGLGLCKRIINNYNGEVKVESVIGKGSIFTIILPVVKVPKSKRKPIEMQSI